MSRKTKDIAKLEVLLSLAQDRLAAAESGLFSPSGALVDRYRADVAIILRELHQLKREHAQAKRLAGSTGEGQAGSSDGPDP